MIQHNDKRQQEARKLALHHTTYIKQKQTKSFQRLFKKDADMLRAFTHELLGNEPMCAQPAEEWLLDHAEFIEEQMAALQEELKQQQVKPRVYHLCAAYLESTDGNVDEQALVDYVNAYQEVSVLTISELWSMPVMLRLAMFHKLAAVMSIVSERRDSCQTVNQLLDTIDPADLESPPDAFRQKLAEAGREWPMSGSLTVHLIKHLRERTEDSSALREWLMCHLDNREESLDKVVAYEHQLQAEYQVTAGNIISSVRKLLRIDWYELYAQMSFVEQTLRTESTGDYIRLDSLSRERLQKEIERISKRMYVPENLVAQEAVKLAEESHKAFAGQRDQDSVPEQDYPRDAFVAYYLLEARGLDQLRQALKTCSTPRTIPANGLKRRAGGVYFQLQAFTFALALLGFILWTGWDRSFTALEWTGILFLLCLPALEWGITAAHWIVEKSTRPFPLLRYDLTQGVPKQAKTVVVIPAIYSTPEEVKELGERLELHYLANRDPYIHFAILGDLKDAAKESLPADREVEDSARAEITRLCDTYPEASFHWLQRKRRWNETEQIWMGWERKRGKLVEFVDMLQEGRTDTSFQWLGGAEGGLQDIQYVLTLDADTELPLESAKRMIGTLHLPYNRPRLNEQGTRVEEGFGVLQPRMGITHEAAHRSRFAQLWSAEPGVDPYAFAMSDPYQDGLGQAIFTGKGIFDVQTFHQVLCQRIPENRVLSHDLLEGGFLRAGLLADLELIDDFPAQFSAHQKRQHRWIRGDWQLLLWLMPKSRNRHGELTPVDLSILTRWQMVDNMRRSLLLPFLFVLLTLGLTVLPGSPVRWTVLVLATCFLPVLRQFANVRTLWESPGTIFAAAGQVLVTWLTLPYQAAYTVDAIVRTLYRLTISKRRLLEWVSAAEVERSSRRGSAPAIMGMTGGYVLIALFVSAALWLGNAASQMIGVALGLFWAAAPFVIGWLNQPAAKQETPLSETDAADLRSLAKDIWTFFSDYVTARENWLPPDNVQLEPDNGIAHRTSPTNIGLYMTCVVAARDFGFINTPTLIERLENTVETIERMSKWEGHLYNWYDTRTLQPLPPEYVSTVDSGNFAACLITVREGLAEWLSHWNELADDGSGEGRFVIDKEIDEYDVAFAEEIVHHDQKRGRSDWNRRANHLLKRLDRLVQQTNFRPLYDEKTKLLSLGYHVGSGKKDTILYDLMASEARQASFVAIAMGQISVSHWHQLGRTMTRVGNQPVLLSWSGTMFEYLMPWLLMRTYRKSIWESTYEAVVNRQIDYARQKRVPFGISESGYYAFDYQMNYQYRAFGVPGLGFKRGLDKDLVISPYATLLALPYAPNNVVHDLHSIQEMGGRGKYGYYEAIDLTASRMPKGRSHMVVQSFMAHHQGMSMLALGNVLLSRKMYDRFHRNRQVRAAELLLQERIPRKVRWIKHPELQGMEREHKPTTQEAVRTFAGAETKHPEAGLLSNGQFSTMITNSGSGFSRYTDRLVTRWREDAVTDPWGSYVYIRNVTEDQLWSPSYQPCQASFPEQQVQFFTDKAVFQCADEKVRTLMEVCVSPEINAEIRRISLQNKSKETFTLELTTFQEIALAPPQADNAHTAFSKLFIRTEYDEETQSLVASRRPREAGESQQELFAAHALIVDGETLGPLEFETDRALFIGRGHTLARPQYIASRLRGTTGAVADPAFVIRQRIEIKPGEEMQLVAVTAVGESKQEVTDHIRRFTTSSQVERTFQLAWNRGQIELRNLQISAVEAMHFQKLAGQIMYRPPLRQEQVKARLANTKGQSGLWPFGLSGDLPIVVVRIDERGQLPFAAKQIVGHEYLRRAGVFYDLAFVIEVEEGYQQELEQSIRHAAEHGVDRFGRGIEGIQVLPIHSLSQDDHTLLLSAARLVLRAGGASLQAQLRLSRMKHILPARLEPGLEAGADAAAAFQSPEPTKAANMNSELQFFNGWGGFTPDGEAYRMIHRNGNHLPAPWINVLANPTFGCFISELGTGYTWWRNSRECKLTPWSNDPVLDPPGEVVYLRDEATAEVWSPTPILESHSEAYTITHEHGSTRFEHFRHGIEQTMDVFVPEDDPVKMIELSLHNKTDQPRELSVTYYAEWVLGVDRQQNSSYIATEWLEEEQLMLARNVYQETFREATAFLGIYALHSGEPKKDMQEVSWTADRNEFIGRNRNWKSPAAMQRVYLAEQTGLHHDSCGAIQLKLSLEPGAKRTIVLLLGCDSSQEAAIALAQKYRRPDASRRAHEKVRHFWEHTLGQMVVETPSPEMDIMLNGWLIYQALGCRMWGRTAFYQAGGAFGFRDQLQDSLALLHVLPELTREQIIRHASHQYVEGDVQHWWHEETERGIRTRFTDDLLWLPYAASRYIVHTGEMNVLDERAPYLQSELLQEGEHERYEPTVLAAEDGPIFEHCTRAIDLALSRIGEHGLPLIGVGDWNDGMNLVGAEGRGESVWLGWFLCDILERFAPICHERGELEREREYLTARERLIEALDEHAWDGQWYRRAFTDSGGWLGTIRNEECRIDAIAQSWSIISGAAKKEKGLQAMQSFDRELVDRELSVVRLLTPPFDQSDPSPGYIQGYPPGIRENGAQYTHGVIWSIVAWSLLGDGNKAFELFHMMNPITHTRTDHEVRQYAGEPYVMAADVYTAEPRIGHAGWTWYTGASGWMYQAGVEWVLGIQRQGDRLKINPSIPDDWPGFKVQYRYGSTPYKIEVQRKHTQRRLLIDGQEFDPSDGVPLKDDGKERAIVLEI